MTFISAARFAVTGVSITAIHVSVAMLFIEFVYPAPVLANGLAFVVATAVSYWVNTVWSFSQSLGGRSLRRFLIVVTIGLALTMAISRIVDMLGGSYFLGIFCIVVSVPLVTFSLHHFWTYR